MSDELDDPFDDDELAEILSDAAGDQIAGALDDAQDELQDATIALARLAHRLREFVPAAAVVNLVTSVAVGTALKEAYG